MKKFLALLLCIVMVLSMAVACGGSKKGTLSLDYLYNEGSGHKAIGEYIQGALDTVGITMTLETQEWATFLDTRKNGEYTIARNGWLADYNDPICFLDMWTSGSGNNDVQYGKGAHANLKMYNLDLTGLGYSDKVTNGTWAQTYDVLITRIKTCTDSAKRYKMMHMAEDMLMATGCITPLYFYTDLYMIDSSVQGFFSNPLGYKYFMNSKIDGQDYINVCLASEPQSLDPALNSAVDGATMIAHLFAGLAKWTEVDGVLSIVADLAESLPEGVTNADGTVTYTYTLKEGLKWSNGDALTAEDFERSWKRAASAALGADYGYMFEVVKGYGTDNPEDLAVEATDDRTLVVTLNNAVAYWNELLAFPTYMPVHSSALNSENWATDPSTYICNGPYTMKSWEHKSKIVLEKNPEFYDAENVTMPTINCFLSDDDNLMLVKFKQGEWQLIDSIPTNEIKNLKNDPQYSSQLKIPGQIGTYYVCWNINKNILPEDSELKGVEAEKAMQEIRNAVSLLLDRNYIVEDVAQGGQVPASSFVAMGMTDADNNEFYKNANSTTDDFDGYYDVSREAYEANVKKALETLKKYYEIKEG
ncbi:MAG: peptide ABC transporter substrate-binding protein [Clostridia bacterium]|nr:peptide ABC transporter substrate-binding protein [Clostridia bacterium]